MQVAYPEHNWNPLSIRAPKNYWETNSHRSLFDGFAKKYFFNSSLDPHQWHSIRLLSFFKESTYFQSVEQIRKTKVYYVLQKMYNRSLIQALWCVYPEHNWNLIFDKSKK